MARNRKNQSAAVRLGPVFRVILICSLIAASGVGYVWQKDQLNDLSRQKVELEKRLWRLRARNAQVYGQLMQLHSPPALEARVKELRLGLIEPAPTQIVRLAEPISGPHPGPTAPIDRQFAKQDQPQKRERRP